MEILTTSLPSIEESTCQVIVGISVKSYYLYLTSMLLPAIVTLILDIRNLSREKDYEPSIVAETDMN